MTFVEGTITFAEGAVIFVGGAVTFIGGAVTFIGGACADGACADGVCVGRACADRACVDRACVGGACAGGAYADGAACLGRAVILVDGAVTFIGKGSSAVGRLFKTAKARVVDDIRVNRRNLRRRLMIYKLKGPLVLINSLISASNHSIQLSL